MAKHGKLKTLIHNNWKNLQLFIHTTDFRNYILKGEKRIFFIVKRSRCAGYNISTLAQPYCFLKPQQHMKNAYFELRPSFNSWVVNHKPTLKYFM